MIIHLSHLPTVEWGGCPFNSVPIIISVYTSEPIPIKIPNKLITKIPINYSHDQSSPDQPPLPRCSCDGDSHEASFGVELVKSKIRYIFGGFSSF